MIVMIEVIYWAMNVLNVVIGTHSIIATIACRKEEFVSERALHQIGFNQVKNSKIKFNKYIYG